MTEGSYNVNIFGGWGQELSYITINPKILYSKKCLYFLFIIILSLDSDPTHKDVCFSAFNWPLIHLFIQLAKIDNCFVKFHLFDCKSIYYLIKNIKMKANWIEFQNKYFYSYDKFVCEVSNNVLMLCKIDWN